MNARSAFVTAPELDRRLALCRGCEHFGRVLGGLLEGCTLCGCTNLKPRLTRASCPLHKW